MELTGAENAVSSEFGAQSFHLDWSAIVSRSGRSRSTIAVEQANPVMKQDGV